MARFRLPTPSPQAVNLATGQESGPESILGVVPHRRERLQISGSGKFSHISSWLGLNRAAEPRRSAIPRHWWYKLMGTGNRTALDPGASGH